MGFINPQIQKKKKIDLGKNGEKRKLKRRQRRREERREDTHLFLLAFE
jgi:hypothetical protein